MRDTTDFLSNPNLKQVQPEIHLMVENIFSISILLCNNIVQTAEELQCHVTLNYTFNQLQYHQQNYIFVICLRFIELSSD